MVTAGVLSSVHAERGREHAFECVCVRTSVCVSECVSVWALCTSVCTQSKTGRRKIAVAHITQVEFYLP